MQAGKVPFGYLVVGVAAGTWLLSIRSRTVRPALRSSSRSCYCSGTLGADLQSAPGTGCFAGTAPGGTDELPLPAPSLLLPLRLQPECLWRLLCIAVSRTAWLAGPSGCSQLLSCQFPLFFSLSGWLPCGIRSPVTPADCCHAGCMVYGDGGTQDSFLSASITSLL